MNRQTETFDPYETIVNKTIDKYIPFKADWEITYRCNLRCVHCYQTGPASQPELTTEQCCDCLDQLAESGCLYLTFTGGEVLLRRDFFKIAGHARKKGFAIRIFTNGTLIDEDIADKIKSLNPLSVEISLYAAKALVHESITGVRGSFAKTVNAFLLLKKRRVNAVVKTTFMKPNAEEFDGLQEFARKIDAPFTFSFTVIPKLDGSKEVTKLRLSEERLKEMFSPRDWLVDEITAGGVRVFEPLCSAGFNSLYISPYGEIFPCVTLREQCGNIKEAKLKAIWESGFIQKLRNISIKDLSECSGCSISYYCDRCAGLALLEDGDLFGPSRNDCTLARVRKQALEEKAARCLKKNDGVEDGKEREEAVR
jgi:radical SAM protein with 4Fe4S-binding SPASM domain